MVVVIIGILTAIAIPNYIGQQDKAKDAAAMAQLRTAATSQQLYYVDQHAYAGTATGDGRGSRCHYLLHGGPWWRRHLQDHPGHGQANSGHMLKRFAKGLTPLRTALSALSDQPSAFCFG